MAGYANGGDSDWNRTSQNTGARLGGNSDAEYTLTGPEIAVIIVTIGLFALAMFLVFYCRSLQMRRKIDMQHRARQSRPAADTEAIEMKDTGSVKTADEGVAVSGSEVGFFPAGDTMSGGRRDLEAGSTFDKPPLWRYIHWKDPFNTPKPKVTKRPESQDNQLTQNPY